MKYVTPLNVFLYFVALGLAGVAFIEYVFWVKHEFYDNAVSDDKAPEHVIKLLILTLTTKGED